MLALAGVVAIFSPGSQKGRTPCTRSRRSFRTWILGGFAACLTLAAFAPLNAKHASGGDRIVYRYHTPLGQALYDDIPKNVKLTSKEGEGAIFVFTKPKNIIGSRNHVMLDIDEDDLNFYVISDKGKTLFHKEDLTGDWSMSSTAHDDRYYLMMTNRPLASAYLPDKSSINPDATYNQFEYPYLTVEISGSQVRRFSCVFDTKRLRSAADRTLIAATIYDGNGSVALHMISRFLSENGADKRTDKCVLVGRDSQELLDLR